MLIMSLELKLFYFGTNVDFVSIAVNPFEFKAVRHIINVWHGTRSARDDFENNSIHRSSAAPSKWRVAGRQRR